MKSQTDQNARALELSDVLGGVPDVVSTTYGPIRITTLGDRTKTPCIAYPDAGLTHQTCFQSLLVACGPQSLLLKNFCIVLIDLPGCEDAEASIPDALQPVTLDKLATQLAEITGTFKLRECLGIGVGFGGQVLLKCAIEHPKLFSGLILVSPACRVAGWWEWSAGQLALANLRLRGWNHTACEHFAKRAFSSATLQLLGGDSDLLKSFHRELQAVPPASAAAYLSLAIHRPSIVKDLPRLKSRVLLMYGADSQNLGDCQDISNGVDKSRFALVEEMHAGTLLTQERPALFLSPVNLFLTALQMEGIGLGVAALVGE
jgi:pimeloyl-ACP methyl ester carboxylesterase